MTLALTDQQLALLQNAAALIPPHDRQSFLRSVANRLPSSPSDDDVAVALRLVLSGRGLAVHRTALKIPGGIPYAVPSP
jgi:hypothetical protein